MAINKVIVGTDVKIDLTGDTIEADKLLSGITAHRKSGETIAGTMPNNGAVAGEISAKSVEYAVPLGYHNGSGKVAINAEEQAKLTPENIRLGTTILGVAGSFGKVQRKSVTPSLAAQTAAPDEGFDFLSQITVNPIPIIETENSAGGITLTIGG